MFKVFLISNFRRVFNIVYILLGISPTSDCSLPTFRNPLSVPSSRAGCTLHPALEDGTDRGSETSAYNNQTPGKHPKEYIIDSKHGESFKSRKLLLE